MSQTFWTIGIWFDYMLQQHAIKLAAKTHPGCDDVDGFLLESRLYNVTNKAEKMQAHIKKSQ